MRTFSILLCCGVVVAVDNAICVLHFQHAQITLLYVEWHTLIWVSEICGRFFMLFYEFYLPCTTYTLDAQFMELNDFRKEFP